MLAASYDTVNAISEYWESPSSNPTRNLSPPRTTPPNPISRNRRSPVVMLSKPHSHHLTPRPPSPKSSYPQSPISHLPNSTQPPDHANLTPHTLHYITLPNRPSHASSHARQTQT
ncbi:uncharacterized protein K460DRAFT_136603 [Cucurbitaria berberidis CBS 394.84]|uniref:Uncharacterized protein n=1 Tax=Cucurbitaria berberidis CBS 394.84 TaxID=1168544 RepID=A0A9P4L646_9PLEO|nr:uncharacterized protein K460DRAFT_136603 [Cucurbitaria berberidis CBS 394.84]KAF1842914.1 hypothetical protein K460DRAFT_136603 [Cucurbitaria berberidis CBS 394.84]